MNCPSCAREIRDDSTTCEHCGAAITAATPDEDPKSGRMLRGAGVLLLIIGALLFLSGATSGAGGTAGLAIVLFVAGLVTFFAGRVHVAFR